MAGKKKLVDETFQPFENVPIYRKAEDVLANAHQIQARMAKSHKYITGAQLCEKCLSLAETVSMAYIETENKKRKLRLIKLIERKCLNVLILHRVANNMRLMDREVYVDQIDRLISII